MQQVKYFRQDHMIFGVFRGVNRDIQKTENGEPIWVMEPTKDPEPKGFVPKLDDNGEKIPVMVSKYFPHEKEGEPNFDDVTFHGDSINSAKKKSRELQGATMGSGILRVLPSQNKQYPSGQGMNPNLRSIKRKPTVHKHRSEHKKGKSGKGSEMDA